MAYPLAVDPIVVPEHAFNEQEAIRFAWRMQMGSIFVLALLSLSYIGFALMAIGIPSYLALIAILLLTPISVVTYRFDTLPKSLRSPVARNTFRKRSFEFSQIGLNVYGDEGMNAYVPWSYFIKARILHDFFLIYLDQNQCYAVPRKLLSKPDDEAVELLITSKIAPVKVG